MRTVILTIIIVLSISCTDSGTEPQPVSHEFMWEVDTLDAQIGNVIPQSFGGNRELGLFLGIFNSSGHNSLLHYNGTSWKYIDLFDISLGYEVTRIINYNGLLGVLGNDGQRCSIGLFDGDKWTRISVPVNRPIVRDIAATNNALFVAGVDGVLSYQNDEWIFLIDSTDSIEDAQGYSFYPHTISVEAGGCIDMITTSRLETGELGLSLWSLKDGVLRVTNEWLFSECPLNGRFATVGEKVFVAGESIFSLSCGRLKVEHETRGVYLAGENSNLFIATEKHISHFNGIDLEEIFDLSKMYKECKVVDMFYLNKTLFVALHSSSGYTYILKGTPER